MPIFDSQGLIPAIVQHAQSGEVLMLGYMNEEALRITLEQQRVTFWSRSRNALWTKGETSGNWLRLVEVRQDCDGDTLLVRAEPAGPTCHTGHESCFHRDLRGETMQQRVPLVRVLANLEELIQQRKDDRPEDSYTSRLLNGGVDRISKKIGEEAAEVIIAAKNGSASELTYEMADLLYHSLVLLANQDVPLEAVWEELIGRATSS
jgi:phosphoribosyl-ATP pyrophosphohydrolase/phosphoribosyl-AMP cyclohydrolase